MMNQEFHNSNHNPQQEELVSEVKEELSQIDLTDLNDHAQRYEELHKKLNEALSSIEGM